MVTNGNKWYVSNKRSMMLMMLMMFVMSGARAQSTWAGGSGSAPGGNDQAMVAGDVEIAPIYDGQLFAVAVRVHGKTKADGALITYQYWVEDKSLGKLLLSHTVVVELAGDVFVVSDGVPVPRKQVKSVEVALVRQIATESFDLEDDDARDKK